MITTHFLTNNENVILKNHYRKSGCALIRERAHVVLLSSQGRKVHDIALILMRKQDTICQWLNAFNQKGLSSIFHKYEGNTNASKLTQQQRKEIAKTLRKPPSTQRLPKSFWDVPAIKSYLKGQFGIVYESNRSYHYLLKFNGLSFKLPALFDIKRDQDQINRRLKFIHQKLPRYFNNDSWEVLVADETRINWETEIRRAWLRKNKKTIVKTHRSSDYQNYFGALNMKTGKTYLKRLQWQNTKQIIKVLKRLSDHYPDKKICLVWDNAGWHKSKELREELKQGCSLGHFHFISFPPYAPDVNPQEHIWQWGKNALGNQVFDSFKKTKASFEQSIRSRFFDYKIPEFVLR